MKKLLNENIEKLKTIDYIIIGIIIILYSILSFHNLGDIKAPQTYYNMVENEMITIKLKNPEDIIKIRYYELQNSSDFQIYVSNDNVDYEEVALSESKGSFSWNETKILKEAKYIRLTSLQESSLGEIALYGNNNSIIMINKIYSNDQRILELTDEQNLIPKTISYKNSTYFDEIYSARTAYEYVNSFTISEWINPPLGKLIQALPIKISGTMSPFFYRLMGNIAGILMIPIMYLLGKEIFKKRKYALFASLLITLDNFHFVQTRIGTIDSFLVLFTMLSFLFMFKYINNKNETINLLLSGIFIGLTISIKYTGLFAFLSLIIIFLVNIIKNKKINKLLVLKSILFFIIIPILIYLLSFTLFPKIININNQSINIIDEHHEIIEYLFSNKTRHDFSSNWYSWPLFIKPVWYYSQEIDTTHIATITSIGNIAIYWFSIIAMIYSIIVLIKKKDTNTLYLLLIILGLVIPNIFINIEKFQYDYFIFIPFIFLIIVNMFKEVEEKYKADYVIPLYLIFVLIVFIIYLPVVSGIPISIEHSEGLRLLNSWYW